ncbi:MAG: hypothetical protein K8E24_003135 [Methanobacterium paludis]|nr:hypothetical protein [Methanobacterium paludis]
MKLPTIYKPKSNYYKKLSYTKFYLIFGLGKSSLETTLITAGISTFIISLAQPGNYASYASILGIVCVIAGYSIDYIGDKYKMKQKDEELLLIEENHEKVIQDKADEIVQKIINKKMDKLEDDLCNKER